MNLTKKGVNLKFSIIIIGLFLYEDFFEKMVIFWILLKLGRLFSYKVIISLENFDFFLSEDFFLLKISFFCCMMGEILEFFMILVLPS